MGNSEPSLQESSTARWSEVVWPKEHGSWSLALEPLVFGLMAAPSVGGVALGVAVVAAFFARQPLRVAVRSADAARRAKARAALGLCGGIALLGTLGAAMAAGGLGWLAWLLPVAAGGAVFIGYDLRNAGREVLAEVAGAAAFAFVPAALAVLAGWTAREACAIAGVMIGRAVPTVLAVRAALRAGKGEETSSMAALVAASLALVAGIGLAWAGTVPRVAAWGLAVLAFRVFALLVFPRPALRARTIGMIEAMLGGAFVVIIALAWRG